MMQCCRTWLLLGVVGVLLVHDVEAQVAARRRQLGNPAAQNNDPRQSDPRQDDGNSMATIRASMLANVNQQRAKQGLGRLCLNSKLSAAAQAHSEYQASTGVMSHTGMKGSTMGSRIDAQGYQWTAVAENVAAGQPDVNSVMTSWMNSPGHRANLLGSYTMIGIGFSKNDNTLYKSFWTQDFGTGSTENCDDGSKPAPPPGQNPAQNQNQNPSQNAPVHPAPIPFDPPKPKPTTPQPATPKPTTAAPKSDSKPSAPTPAPTKPGSAPTPAPTKPGAGKDAGPSNAAKQATDDSGPSTASSSPSDVSSMATKMLELINAERSKKNLAKMCLNKKLQAVAQSHSEDEASMGNMTHDGSSGKSMSERFDAQGFNWTKIAENLAAGQPSLDEVMQSWMGEDGYRQNILGDYQYFGMGYATNDKTTYKTYWTQAFGKAESESCDDGSSSDTGAEATPATTTASPTSTAPSKPESTTPTPAPAPTTPKPPASGDHPADQNTNKPSTPAPAPMTPAPTTKPPAPGGASTPAPAPAPAPATDDTENESGSLTDILNDLPTPDATRLSSAVPVGAREAPPPDAGGVSNEYVS